MQRLAIALLFVVPGCAAQRTFLFNMTNQAFQNGKPGALVYLPSTFNRGTQRLRLLVFIHGWQNCIHNCVRPPNQTIACTPGQPPRSGYSILQQIEDAHVSSNTLLVVPEVAYDQQSSDPGNFAKPQFFRQFLEELFSKWMAPVLGQLNTSDIERIRLFSHSGGYWTTGNMAMVGGVPVQDINLLDSLYGDFAQFDGFVQNNLKNFGPGANQYRFSSIYTDGGGTMANSQAMAGRAKNWVAAAGRQDQLLFDDTTATLPPAAYQHSLIFKHSALSHDAVPRYYFGQLITNAQ